MDETLAYTLVYAKTAKGLAEINARSGALSLQMRRVLIMIDGRRPVAELMAVVRAGEFDGIMAALEQHAMIEKVDPSQLPVRNLEEEDFADTISLLEENAAALRAQPHVHPAAVAQAPARAERQDEEPQPVAAPAMAAQTIAEQAGAIAARAVAAAAARPAEDATRRPPTLSGAAALAVAHDVPSGKARPGTLTGLPRMADPARRPPTLTGSRAPAAERPPTLTGSRPPAAERSPEAAPRPAAPAVIAATDAAPSPAPSTASTALTNSGVRTLEEEKRIAVKELYAQLGPYGEQPAARLQECTTMDALREQIKQAGRRVATFKGEKAAQEYLRSIGHA
jgi:hypothetical protein